MLINGNIAVTAATAPRSPGSSSTMTGISSAMQGLQRVWNWWQGYVEHRRQKMAAVHLRTMPESW